MLKGRIHSFETFGTLDGPGIRFVVFMQGCPFRCLYCHNPDSWDTGSGNEYTVENILTMVRKYIPYFQSSGGGVTVSGGEPLMQAEFVAALFKRCKDEGIHTTLDTNGYSLANTEAILPFTDLVLLDIKHMDTEKHSALTGFANDNPLAFARLLSNNSIPVWLRYVLVPGLTDDAPDLTRFGTWARTLSNVEKIEILPFHKMGEFKWTSINYHYNLYQTPEATENDINRANRLIFACL